VVLWKRELFGKTTESLSVVGFGGIVVTDESPNDAKNLISKAVERGINYFDVAPFYGDAQEKMGPALLPYRAKAFLSCKTLKRQRDGARKELEDSLKKLKTDYFDLYQFHAVTKIEEVEEIMGKGGAMEAVEKAKEKGLIRYIGFSAHTEEAALALMEKYDFSSILFPINWASWLKNGFGQKVFAYAESKGIAVLALKALAKRSLRKMRNPNGLNAGIHQLMILMKHPLLSGLLSLCL
jgi:aryl-alcohol dehydrogenase-like predicted oxidoreductase